MRTVELSASQCEVRGVHKTACRARLCPVCPASEGWKRGDAAFLAALNSHWVTPFWTPMVQLRTGEKDAELTANAKSVLARIITS